LITVYSSFSLVIAVFIHLIVVCALHHYPISARKKNSLFQFSEVITPFRAFLRTLISDFCVSLGSYLSGTQFLVFLLQALDAQIGFDVIISDISCLTDPHLVSMGDHVRLHINAYIQVRHIFIVFLLIISFFFCPQCHTFERRLLKMAPVTVNQSSVLMSNTLVLPEYTCILPLTLVMKNDQIPSNTTWSGVPAQRTI
jgi:hypothetical protein